MVGQPLPISQTNEVVVVPIFKNIILFQVGWLICVLAAANQLPWLGTSIVFLIVIYHLFQANNMANELVLLSLVAVVGTIWESLLVSAGWLIYPSGMLVDGLAPHWIIAMWLLFGTALNVSLRWLKRRWLTAALLGALSGPASFYAGHKLGGVMFSDIAIALPVLAVGWAMLMPLIMFLSNRYDGFGPPPLKLSFGVKSHV